MTVTGVHQHHKGEPSIALSQPAKVLRAVRVQRQLFRKGISRYEYWIVREDTNEIFPFRSRHSAAERDHGGASPLGVWLTARTFDFVHLECALVFVHSKMRSPVRLLRVVNQMSEQQAVMKNFLCCMNLFDVTTNVANTTSHLGITIAKALARLYFTVRA